MSGIPAWAYRGAPVVCVADYSFLKAPGEVVPEVDDTYTIREFFMDGDEAYIRLVEVRNLGSMFREEVVFNLEGFRPAITQQDDISTHFARYLNTGKDASLKPVREGV